MAILYGVTDGRTDRWTNGSHKIWYIDGDSVADIKRTCILDASPISVGYVQEGHSSDLIGIFYNVKMLCPHAQKHRRL